jgi:hypothetical protein
MVLGHEIYDQHNGSLESQTQNWKADTQADCKKKIQVNVCTVLIANNGKNSPSTDDYRVKEV